MSFACARFVVLCSSFLCLYVQADPFLQRRDGRSLIDDLESALGHGSLYGRVDKIETRLQPMFLSLQKAARNRVGHAGARYALHRINIDLHGWNIIGLEPNESTFNATSLTGSGILSGLLPDHIANIFKEHIHEDGFDLRDLALLAGTIEHLVHDDQKHILRDACHLLDLPSVGPLEENSVRMLVQIYMLSFLQSAEPKSLADLGPENAVEKMHELYPGWTDAILFLDDERESLTYSARGQTNPFRSRASSFQDALQVVERVADRFTRNHADLECQEIKGDLLAYERGDTGRVRLADFYRAGQESRFFLTETKDYLRAAGALDESDPLSGAKVIVPNYVLLKSNCMSRTRIYSTCCINECEGLYAQLEQALAAPMGTPKEIASLTSSLSSSTVQAPRNLSRAVLTRLDEIAIGHDGNVLLHSRLFAQWMHLAFPRECPYPHLVGTTTSLSPEAWAEESGLEWMVAEGTQLDHEDTPVPAHEAAGEVDLGAELMWTSEEEHFVAAKRSWTACLKSAMSALFANVLFWRLAILVSVAMLAKALFLPNAGISDNSDKLFV